MKALVLILPLALMPLAACVTTNSTTVAPAQTLSGTIVSSRAVTITNNTDQVAGAVVGAIAGGIIGNQFGQGSGNAIMTGAGAAGGAMAGSQLAKGANTRISQEWTVRLVDGRTVTLIQDGSFRIGQKVTIAVNGNSMRMMAA